MKKLLYKSNGVTQSIDVPPDATDPRIVDLPEVGDLVRITKMGTGNNDRPEYIGKIGKVRGVHGSGGNMCMADEILVVDLVYYVKGWEIIARKGEVL